MKFRKKPVVVEAEQFWSNQKRWLDENVGFGMNGVCWINGPDDKIVPILDIGNAAIPLEDGDWIITGIKGEKYPCKPDIFEAIYERCE